MAKRSDNVKNSRENGTEPQARGKFSAADPTHGRGPWHLLKLLIGAATVGISARGFAMADRTQARKPAGHSPDRKVVNLEPASTGSQRQDGSEPGRRMEALTPACAVVRKVDSGFVALARELFDRFNTDLGFTRGAALAFVGVLSLIPVLLMGLAVLGFFIRDPQQAAQYVQQIVARMVPGPEAYRAANNVIQQTNVVPAAEGLIRGRFWSAVIGVVSLLWTAISLFVTAADSMNAAWEVKETRGFVKLRLVALGVFVGAGLLFVLSFVPSAGPGFIRNLHIPWLGLPKSVPLWLDLLFMLVAWAVDIAMFVLIYKFLPNTSVTWKAALFSGVITGLLWEVFKKGFSLYLAHFGNFNKLYGTLGGLMLLVTWIYYSCILLLAGAIIAKMYHEHTEEGGVVCKGAEKRAVS